MSDPADLDPSSVEESNTEWFIGVTGTFCFFSLLCVGARTYTRFVLVKSARWDDYIMLLAALMSFGGMVCFLVQIQYGLGKHMSKTEPEDWINFNRISFVQTIIADIGAIGVAKLSLALSLLRLAQNRWFRRALWGLTGFIVVYTLFSWGNFTFYCKPISAYWTDIENPGSKCYSIPLLIAFAVTHTTCNILSDICLAALPIPIIWPLQMKLRSRIYLVAIMSLGYIAVGFGIVKAYFQFGFQNDPGRRFDQIIQFWGFLQLNAGIIAASAPTLRPLLGKTLGLNTTKKYGTGYGTAGQRYGRSGTGIEAAPYELHDRAADGAVAANTSVARGTVVYGRRNSPNDMTGSEEEILRSYNGKGIMQTTEVAIQRD